MDTLSLWDCNPGCTRIQWVYFLSYSSTSSTQIYANIETHVISETFFFGGELKPYVWFPLKQSQRVPHHSDPPETRISVVASWMQHSNPWPNPRLRKADAKNQNRSMVRCQQTVRIYVVLFSSCLLFFKVCKRIHLERNSEPLPTFWIFCFPHKYCVAHWELIHFLSLVFIWKENNIWLYGLGMF